MATKSSSPSPSLFTSPFTISNNPLTEYCSTFIYYVLIDQLIDVFDLLKRCGFPQTRWYELGLRLGLHKDTLDAMEVTLRGDVSRCLTECLSQWLSRADNVDSRGGATFDSLSDALKSMNENAAADKLDQESKLISLIVLVLTVCVCILNLGSSQTSPRLRIAWATPEATPKMLLKFPPSIDPSLEQQPSVSEGPLQPVDGTAQSHTPQPTISQSQSSTPTTVIELSSKSEVATNIKRLHSHFASLDSNIRDEFEELVENGKVKLKAVARSAAAYLSIKVSTLKYGDVDEFFDSLQPHYDFFSCGVLKHLTDTYLSNAQTELTQYIDSVDKFSESSQLKHIRSIIKEKLSSLPAAASPTTSDQTKPVVIKLNDRWEEMTISKLKAVLKHYFGVTSDLFSHISFDYGSFIITLLIPTSLSQYLIDTINNKINSMSRLGILEVAVDNEAIPIRREDNNNFNTSLHESVKAGDSFEVSMLLQLGADPNSKDERGKSAVEIANEGGHTQIKEILLTGGGELIITY